MRTIRLLAFLALPGLMMACTSCQDAKEPAAPPVRTTQGQPAAPAPAGGANPVVVIDVQDMGAIKLELYPDKAPRTVANFLRYVDDKHYDYTVFHRVNGTFMIQGGGFTPDYKEKPTREPIPNEAANGLKNEPGTIAMARTPDPHSASAQFFINTVPNAMLDFRSADQEGFGYAVFGRVIEGMDVVRKIGAVPTETPGPQWQWRPKTPVIIRSIRRAK